MPPLTSCTPPPVITSSFCPAGVPSTDSHKTPASAALPTTAAMARQHHRLHRAPPRDARREVRRTRRVQGRRHPGVEDRAHAPARLARLASACFCAPWKCSVSVSQQNHSRRLLTYLLDRRAHARPLVRRLRSSRRRARASAGRTPPRTACTCVLSPVGTGTPPPTQPYKRKAAAAFSVISSPKTCRLTNAVPPRASSIRYSSSSCPSLRTSATPRRRVLAEESLASHAPPHRPLPPPCPHLAPPACDLPLRLRLFPLLPPQTAFPAEPILADDACVSAAASFLAAATLGWPEGDHGTAAELFDNPALNHFLSKFEAAAMDTLEDGEKARGSQGKYAGEFAHHAAVSSQHCCTAALPGFVPLGLQ